MTEAIVRPCSVTLGVATVTIPDVCLEQSGPITAWVFEIAGEKGTTTKTITLPVVARPRPTIREEIPEAFTDEYQTLITEVNNAANALKEGHIVVGTAQHAYTADQASSAYTAEQASAAYTADRASSAYTADQASNAYNADYAINAGHADTSGEANSLNLSQQHWGYMEEYEITTPGVYLVMTGTATSVYTDILCIPSWALREGQRVKSEHAVYDGSYLGLGYIRPYNESGQIRCVLKIGRGE